MQAIKWKKSKKKSVNASQLRKNFKTKPFSNINAKVKFLIRLYFNNFRFE